MAFPILAVVLLLMGCKTTVWETADSMNCRYAGHHIEEFLQNYDTPFLIQQCCPLAVEPYVIYPAPLENAAELPYAHIEFVEPPIGTERQYCTLRIQTDNKGIIQRLVLASDSGGEYDSFCAKVFGAAATGCLQPPNSACAAGACP